MTLHPLYVAVAWLITHIHDGTGAIFGESSGASWALSIVLLTIAMRLLLFPLFVKQIKNQRQMQLIQPKMKELQAKYKNDKEKLNQEMMALWKEHGANPFAGCLPLLVQFPIFIALFRVLNSIKPDSHGNFNDPYGMGGIQVVEHAAKAKIFGVPIAAAFDSSSKTLGYLGASSTSTKVLAVILIVIMAATTFITQRQLMARSAASGAAPMSGQQKVLLYVLPVVFAFWGFKFPMGVLLYWLTTNVWSMGQQFFVIRRMDVAAAPAGAAPAGPAGPAPGAKPVKPATPPTAAPAPNLVPPTKPATGSGSTGPRRPGNRGKRKGRGRR